jgi:hypothetical protein
MEDELSPDGRTLVQWSQSDGRMSHVICTPNIFDAASGESILRCRDSGFDASIAWRDDGGFDIDLRHYWRAGTLSVTVDRAAGTFRMAGGGEAQPSHKLGELSAFVEAHFQAADRAAMKKGPPGPLLEDRLEHQLRSNARALWLLLAFGLAAAIWALFLRR